jgi:hypothetical protein
VKNRFGPQSYKRNAAQVVSTFFQFFTSKKLNKRDYFRMSYFLRAKGYLDTEDFAKEAANNAEYDPDKDWHIKPEDLLVGAEPLIVA